MDLFVNRSGLSQLYYIGPTPNPILSGGPSGAHYLVPPAKILTVYNEDVAYLLGLTDKNGDRIIVDNAGLALWQEGGLAALRLMVRPEERATPVEQPAAKEQPATEELPAVEEEPPFSDPPSEEELKKTTRRRKAE